MSALAPLHLPTLDEKCKTDGEKNLSVEWRMRPAQRRLVQQQPFFAFFFVAFLAGIGATDGG
jgi:hypothetical protein